MFLFQVPEEVPCLHRHGALFQVDVYDLGGDQSGSQVPPPLGRAGDLGVAIEQAVKEPGRQLPEEGVFEPEVDDCDAPELFERWRGAFDFSFAIF